MYLNNVTYKTLKYEYGFWLKKVDDTVIDEFVKDCRGVNNFFLPCIDTRVDKKKLFKQGLVWARGRGD